MPVSGQEERVRDLGDRSVQTTTPEPQGEKAEGSGKSAGELQAPFRELVTVTERQDSRGRTEATGPGCPGVRGRERGAELGGRQTEQGHG